jgi:cytochrome c-type biogenesis protein CcmH/NrfG
MLFERIRRTQKPVFIFLAVMFGLGFVLLGVGSGAGGPSLGDIFGQNQSSGPSVDELRSRVAENPNDAQSWQRLAQALQADGQEAEAIEALQKYVDLRPKDALGLSSLASLVERSAQRKAVRASALLQQASIAQAQTGSTAVSELRLASGLSQPLLDAVAQPVQTRASALQGQAASDYQRAMQLRLDLVDLDPRNASYQFLLASDALNANNYPVALDALREYLRLEPDAANKREVRSVIRQLEGLVNATGGGDSTTPAG